MFADRLLLDDIGVGAADDKAFLFLDSHPNLSVSLFNPIALRGSRKMGLLADARRLNHRMHDKSMTADNTLSVVGGRNIGNEYFGLNELTNFADMDAFVVGPVASALTDSFDVFWNSPASIPISAFHKGKTNPEQRAKARLELDEYVRENCGRYYAAMRATHFTLELKEHALEFYWGKISVLYDTPEKSLGKATTDTLLQQLGNMLGKVQSDLFIISPYFVPGDAGARALVAAVQRGVRVRIVTNSLASTDVGAVHAGYKKYRRKLLEGGVALYEMMPSLNIDAQDAGTFSITGSAAASLHAKMFLFDRQRVFIGSMNLDPRSVDINTEIGLLIDNPALAQQFELNVAKMLGNICHSVVLEPKNPSRPEAGQRLVWMENAPGKELRYTQEPNTTSWQRFRVGLIGLLPVESQL
jgi:putative cardiolipin synthase